ncbi:MAG: hypothetical protein ETSY1_19440 [Candidatus Entotheonella factor]|uniref:HPr kinase/phosphorylase C-terminal domain-containing protein n=1 Tax=Entotheonella factor TaxID=1429438 RepID=W4LLQ3_ENTF1|nr:MAG: hypothetical protein ETSY1_19440 [Candidatus Entotheonella factor]
MFESRLMTAATTSFHLRIAGLTIGVWGHDETLKMQLDPAMRAFSVAAATPDIAIQASYRMLSENPADKPVFESGGLWRLSTRHGRPCFRFVSPYFGTIPYKEACFTADFSRGEVHLHKPYFSASQRLYPLEYPLDELLILYLLSQRRGVEVHACGIIDADGRGHVFMGHSGAGKTTLAKLWATHPDITILSDDRIILRHTSDGYCIYGTPWHGEAHFACTAEAPLASLVWIGHGSHHTLTPLAPVEAIGRLMSCSFPPFYNPEALAWMLEFSTGLVHAIPTYQLAFLPNRHVLTLLQSRLMAI